MGIRARRRDLSHWRGYRDLVSQSLVYPKKLAEVQQISRQLQLSVGRHFDVKSCDRCHENKMLVVSINSNGKSVRYRCGFCRKTAYACATSPDSIEALHHAQKLSDAVGVDYQSASATRIVKIPKNLKIFVAASERPMPYEKDSRNTKKKTKKKARRAPRAKH